MVVFFFYVMFSQIKKKTSDLFLESRYQENRLNIDDNEYCYKTFQSTSLATYKAHCDIHFRRLYHAIRQAI